MPGREELQTQAVPLGVLELGSMSALRLSRDTPQAPMMSAGPLWVPQGFRGAGEAGRRRLCRPSKPWLSFAVTSCPRALSHAARHFQRAREPRALSCSLHAGLRVTLGTG